MKTLTCALGLFLFLSAVTYSEMYRTTSSDLYEESYRTQMKRLAGMSIAEFRAGEYRQMYEYCDLHHNCSNSSAGYSDVLKVPFVLPV